MKFDAFLCHGAVPESKGKVENVVKYTKYSFAATDRESISYQVRKDNIVLYKGNRYRVPKGTYSPGKKVFMVVNDDIISVTDCLTGEIYATHPLCHEKGRLIGQKREERDKSKSLLELEALVQELFENNELVMPFLNHIHQEKPRYYRDQLGVIVYGK